MLNRHITRRGFASSIAALVAAAVAALEPRARTCAGKATCAGKVASPYITAAEMRRLWAWHEKFPEHDIMILSRGGAICSSNVTPAHARKFLLRPEERLVAILPTGAGRRDVLIYRALNPAQLTKFVNLS